LRSFDSCPQRRVAVVPRSDRFGAFGASLLLLPARKLMLAYGRIDYEREVNQKAIIESSDGGRIWGRPHIVAEARGVPKTLRADSLSRLRDGRIALVGVHQGREGRATGFEIRFSRDGGSTWDKPVVVEGKGTVPWGNRIIESDDRLLVTTRAPWQEGGTRKVVMQSESEDGGRTWLGPRIVAEDPVLKLTEPSTTRLSDGRLMTVIRETSYDFHPSLVIFSSDGGWTWSHPEEMPIFGHEMCLGQLRSGNVMVAYRHVGGYAATIAWIGSPEERGFQVPATIRANEPPRLEKGLLRLKTSGIGETILYHLHPPESIASTIHIEADLKCLSNEANACGIHVAQAGWVCFHPDRVELPGSGRLSAPIDGTHLHHYEIIRDSEKLVVSADGEGLVETRQLDRGEEVHVEYGVLRPANVNAFGTRSPFWGSLDTESRGEAYWASIKLRMENPSHPPHSYGWSACSGRLPNQYEENRMVEIENGYGQSIYFLGQVSWVQLPGGEIFLAAGRQYIRPDGRRSSWIRGCYLREEDFGLR
jgi:hypothetical protein